MACISSRFQYATVGGGSGGSGAPSREARRRRKCAMIASREPQRPCDKEGGVWR